MKSPVTFSAFVFFHHQVSQRVSVLVDPFSPFILRQVSGDSVVKIIARDGRAETNLAMVTRQNDFVDIDPDLFQRHREGPISLTVIAVPGCTASIIVALVISSF